MAIPNPLNNPSEEPQELTHEVVSKSHLVPQVEPTLAEVKRKLNEMPAESPYNKGIYAKLESDLFDRFGEFDKAELTEGVRKIMEPLLAPEVLHAGTPMEAMLRRFTFQKAKPDATPEDFMQRLSFLEKYLFNNLLCVDVPAGADAEQTAKRIEEAKDSAKMIFHAEKRRLEKGVEAYKLTAPEELGNLSMYLDEPILVLKVTAPQTDEEYTRKRIYNYQLNRDSRISLFARQVADHMAHLPEANEYFGLAVDNLFHPRAALPEEIQGVVPPADDTPVARDAARTANAGLGLSKDMLEYAMDRQRQAHVMEQWFEDPTFGDKRKQLFKSRVFTNQAQQLLNMGSIQSIDPALHADIEKILQGDTTSKNTFHRERLQGMQDALKPVLGARTVPQSLMDRQPALMTLDKRINTGSTDTTMQEWNDRLYENILKKLPNHVTSASGTPEYAAADKLAKLPLETANIPQDLSADEARSALEFLEGAAVGKHEVNFLIDTVRHKRKEIAEELRLECTPTLFQSGAHAKIDALMQLVFRQPEAQRFDFASYSPEDQKEIQDLGILNTHGTWTTDKAKFGTILHDLAKLRQTEAFLQDICDNFCAPGTSYTSLTGDNYNRDSLNYDKIVTVDAVETLKEALTEYEARNHQGEETWQAAAIEERVVEMLNDVSHQLTQDVPGKEALMAKKKGLELLRERLQHGYMTPKLLEAILADASIAPDLKPQGDVAEAFKHGIIASQVDKSTELALDFLDRGAMVPEGLKPGEQSALDDMLHEHVQQNSEALNSYLKDNEFGSIQDTLARLSDGTLTFNSPGEAEKTMNALCNQYRKLKGMPELPNMRIGKGAWYHFEGKVKQPGKGKGKKKQPDEEIALDFFAGIRKVIGGKVQLGDKHGPWMPLEQFVFHVVNSMVSPDPEFKARWVHDNTVSGKDMSTKEALIQNAGMNEDYFEKGAMIMRGGEPYAKILGTKEKGLKVDFRDKKNKSLGKGDISYTEYYLLRNNPPDKKHIELKPADPLEDLDNPERSVNLFSLKSIFQIGKAIFDYKKKQIKDFRDIRTKYQVLYWFKQGGKSIFDKHSIWLKVKSEINSLEDDMAKSYLEELKSKQSSQIGPFVLKEMERFSKIDLNEVTSGSPLTDLMGAPTVNKHRAEFITLMTFLLEKYGTLYPFEQLEKFRVQNFWLSKIQGSKEENKLGRELALKNKGSVDGQAEIWQIVGQMRARPYLYGDERASKVESSYETGKDNRHKHKEKELSMKQTTDQVQIELGECLKKGDWAGIVLCFRKMGEKGVSAQDMFNCFLYFYVQITRHGMKGHKLPPQVPVEELKKLSTTMFQSTPDLYFFLFKGPENIQFLEKILSDKNNDPDFYKTDWEWDKNMMPKPKSEKTAQLYKKFTMASDKKKGVKGDYSLLNGYSTDPDNNYVVKCQAPQVPTPFQGFNIADDDKDMWKRNNLLFFNEVVLENFVYKNIGQAGMENVTHSVRYLEGLMDSLEDLIASDTVNEVDKQAFLNKFKAAFFKKIYGHFSFKETLDAGTHVSVDETLKRDYFMNTYYGRLKSMGFSVGACAAAADPNTKRVFDDTLKDNMPVETTAVSR